MASTPPSPNLPSGPDLGGRGCTDERRDKHTNGEGGFKESGGRGFKNVGNARHYQRTMRLHFSLSGPPTDPLTVFANNGSQI